LALVNSVLSTEVRVSNGVILRTLAILAQAMIVGLGFLYLRRELAAKRSQPRPSEE
jgi:hypothetical protein